MNMGWLSPTSLPFICIVFILVYFLGFSQVIILDSLAENGGYSYKSQPIGSGPFPGVLYSHGGLGNSVGGDLRGTCIALAQNGYMGWCNRRTTDIPMAPHVVQIEAALDSLLSQTDVDVNNIGIIGFSRGGLLTIMTAVSRYNDVKAVVTMALRFDHVLSLFLPPHTRYRRQRVCRQPLYRAVALPEPGAVDR